MNGKAKSARNGKSVDKLNYHRLIGKPTYKSGATLSRGAKAQKQLQIDATVSVGKRSVFELLALSVEL